MKVVHLHLDDGLLISDIPTTGHTNVGPIEREVEGFAGFSNLSICGTLDDCSLEIGSNHGGYPSVSRDGAPIVHQPSDSKEVAGNAGS